MSSTDNDNGSFGAYYGDIFPCKRSAGQILSVIDQNRSLNRIFLIQNTLQQAWVYCTGYYLIDIGNCQARVNIWSQQFLTWMSKKYLRATLAISFTTKLSEVSGKRPSDKGKHKFLYRLWTKTRKKEFYKAHKIKKKTWFFFR